MRPRTKGVCHLQQTVSVASYPRAGQSYFRKKASVDFVPWMEEISAECFIHRPWSFITAESCLLTAALRVITLKVVRWQRKKSIKYSVDLFGKKISIKSRNVAKSWFMHWKLSVDNTENTKQNLSLELSMAKFTHGHVNGHEPEHGRTRTWTWTWV